MCRGEPVPDGVGDLGVANGAVDRLAGLDGGRSQVNAYREGQGSDLCGVGEVVVGGVRKSLDGL